LSAEKVAPYCGAPQVLVAFQMDAGAEKDLEERMLCRECFAAHRCGARGYRLALHVHSMCYGMLSLNVDVSSPALAPRNFLTELKYPYVVETNNVAYLKLLR
jgi:hypothetical protein